MVNKMEMNVIKRNGEKEPLNYEKINKVLMWAVENLTGVSASQVAMNAQIQFYKDIKTNDIHNVLIQSAVELISENEPNYQYVASNLLNFYLRKNIFNTFDNLPHIKDIIIKNVNANVYDKLLLSSFTDDEFDKINSFIRHDRDFNFTWAGLQQLVDKYLIKDRITSEIYETPQYMYMFISMTLFADFKGDKLSMIKTFYNLISKWKISLPTPIMCGVRTPNRQYSSCFPSNQQVLTINGLCNIEDININDIVLTHNNKYSKVIAKANKKYSGKLIKINTYNTLKKSFTSTSEHLIYTIKSNNVECVRELSNCLTSQSKSDYCFSKKDHYKNPCINLEKIFTESISEWVEANDIEIGDWIKIPFNNKIETIKQIKISEIIELPENYVVVDDKIIKKTTDIRQRSGEYNDKIKPLNNIINLDSEFFRLIGYYLAEGHLLDDVFGLTFNINELYYIEDCKNIFKNIFGYELHSYDNKDNSCKLSGFSQIIPKFIFELVKKDFDKKFISNILMNSDPILQKELLIGILRGDGFSFKQGMGISLTNKNLIYQIYEISLRCGLTPSITYIKAKKSSKESYRIDLSSTNDYKFFLDVGKDINKINISKKKIYNNGKWVGNSYYSKVKSIDIEDVYDINVHDLQIEGDNSFVVNGLAVHNCTLIDIGDSLQSIYSSNTAVGYYTSKRAGIGLNVGRIRAIGSSIRGGEVVHTGVVPFLKMLESTTKSCTQNGVRGGSSTTYIPFWHKEIEDILVLKNNKGSDDNRVRKMDYGIQFCRLFYKRFVSNENITLFSPHEVKDLYDAFGNNEKFEELYEKYEKDPTISKKIIKSRDLMNQFCQERIGTGRIYVMNIDHANDHSSFLELIKMSNLCTEITLFTSPLNHIDDGKIVKRFIKVKNSDLEKYKFYKEQNQFYLNGATGEIHNLSKTNFFELLTKPSSVDDSQYFEEEFEMMWGDTPAEIALCVLSAINLGTIKDLKELDEICEFAVRALDFVITNQDYPVEAAKKMLHRRSMGIGITNLAYYFAKHNVGYGTQESLILLDETMEHIQYYLIKASVKLAKEYGKCKFFNKTKYSKGILPIDTYSKNVDEIIKREHSLDWETLRQDVLTHGMRNSTLSSLMPCESSSLISNSTNGIEPPRALITSKKSKQGIIKLAVPEVYKLKNKYRLAFDISNKEYTNVQAVIQKWVDQGISGNHYYSAENGKNISISDVVKDILYFYKMGGKQLYYANTSDGKTDDINKMMNEKSNQVENVSDDEDCVGGSCSV